jgi:ubiquinone/menaquinone biosynthesis C-methylase UbiE
MSKSSQPSFLPPDMVCHYEGGAELDRLTLGTGPLELARTQELLVRHLPVPPATILDVGGGTGTYACLLASRGYQVHLIDPIPLHVREAQTASQRQPAHPIASIALGDARHLSWPDETADAVLLLGPLYHLTEREDRRKVLQEARRVLRAGGLVVAAGISRFASALDGLKSGFLDDPVFQGIVEQDLVDGQHRNPTDKPFYFATAYFHHPDELAAELDNAGFQRIGIFAVEGPAWLFQNFSEHWSEPGRRDRLLKVVRALEVEPTLLGVSAHLLAIGRKER